eukprot:4374141-Alexandrium_andersonii.AAC.1
MAAGLRGRCPRSGRGVGPWPSSPPWTSSPSFPSWTSCPWRTCDVAPPKEGARSGALRARCRAVRPRRPDWRPGILGGASDSQSPGGRKRARG